MKYVLLLLPILFTGCLKQVETPLCEIGDSNRVLVKNNIVNRVQIREDFTMCMKGNSNRDVTYNDTNELAKTCRSLAFTMNGGVDVTGQESYYANIEQSLYKCGELKNAN